MGRDGSGFLRCSDGHLRWGLFGAAGVVFITRNAPGVSGPTVSTGDGWLVMLQKRSAMAHEGGTWSCAGGAIDEDETPLAGALRESSEEVGALPERHTVVGEVLFAPADDWQYTTFVVEVDAPFGASINFETDAIAWVTPDEVEALALHAGFAAAWPEIRSIIDSLDSSDHAVEA